MSGQTEAERKVATIIERALGDSLKEQPHLKELLNEVTLSNYSFKESIPGAVVVSMPLELLVNVKLGFSKTIGMLKKEFPGQMVLVRRSGEVPQKKGYAPNRVRNEIIKDIVFPAEVTGHSTFVESKTNMFEKLFLNGRQPYWSGAELKALEKVLHALMNEQYTISVFTPVQN